MDKIKITKNDALLVIDMQNDFYSKATGTLYVEGAEHTTEKIPLLMSTFSHFGAPIILTQDWHPPKHISFASTHQKPAFTEIEVEYGQQMLWPDHCVQGTHGAELCDFLPTCRATAIIRKGWRKNVDSYSAMFENDHETPTGLHGMLTEAKVERVFVCGLALDYCVGFSAKDILETMNVPVFIIEDATAAVFPDTITRIPGVAYIGSGEIDH